MPDKRSTQTDLLASNDDADDFKQRDQTIQRQPMAKLLIEEPKVSDEGLYKCDVTYVKGKCPSISLVRVQILSLPAKAKLSSNTQSALVDGQLVGPYNEHEQLKLSCLVQGGRPAPRSVIWRKIDLTGRTTNLISGQKQISIQRQAVENLIQVDLNHTLVSSDLGAKFECHVEHEALDEPAQVARVVSINNAHSEQPFKAFRSSPLDGESDSAASESNPDAMLDLHPAMSGLKQQSSSSSSLKRSDSLDSHVLIDLNVGVSSLDLFMSKVNKQNSSEPLREGDLVELECVAYNSKPPANISWFNGLELIEQLDAGSSTWQNQKQGRHKRLLQRHQVHQNGDGQTYNTHSFLSIKVSRHENRAQLSCQAQNGAPMRQPVIKSLELQVLHTPIVLMEPAAGIVIGEEDSSSPITSKVLKEKSAQVNIYCIYSANPSELIQNSTRWFKDGKPLMEVASLEPTADQLAGAQEHRLVESQTATGYPTLTIKHVNRRDAGLYECQVANSVGFSERLPSGDACKLEVNFKPSVQMRLLKPSSGKSQLAYELNELTEVDLNQELVVVGNAYVLVCDILEAQPKRIQKFYWFKSEETSSSSTLKLRRNLIGESKAADNDDQQLMSITESNQFVLSAIPANFTQTNYACAAANSLGVSEQSNRIQLQLSYTPGPSLVRPVNDLAKRKSVLNTQTTLPTGSQQATTTINFQQLLAGRELLLECVTGELGQPRANIWLWFKDGQAIELGAGKERLGGQDEDSLSSSAPFAAPSSSLNPISGGTELLLLSHSADNNPKQRKSLLEENYNVVVGQQQQRSQQSSAGPRLLKSGRYLFIPAIQLADRGNYSCVAVNRLGSSQQNNQSSSLLERDSYRLSVALAPSFLKALPSRSYWPETESSNSAPQFELLCHVQCEPICQIDWLKNNQPLEQSNDELNEFVQYEIKELNFEERLEENLFRSIESRLVFNFKPLKLSFEQLNKRRRLLQEANYTCQSSANQAGLPVRSTSKFIVQYPPEKVSINAPSDKLNLVEGSNGPQLSCEASGEPQVEYSWFVWRTGDKSFSGTKHSALATTATDTNSIIQSSDASAEQAINQQARGVSSNDLSSAQPDTKLFGLEQAGTGEQVGVGANLDLSNLSLERRQAGYYICEAQNTFGSKRQSVYVNVLYKPTCATLHLYSLDITNVPALEFKTSPENKQESIYVPNQATANDEYSIIRESNEDFIDFRKMLLNSPKATQAAAAAGLDKETLRSEIFKTLSNEMRSNSLMKSGDALIETSADTQSESNNLIENFDNIRYLGREANSTDTWDRLNIVLLRFLNDYKRQIGGYKLDKKQSKRSQFEQANKNKQQPFSSEGRVEFITRNLLTFACLAQDGNPINNLTFEWSLGSVKLADSRSDETKVEQKPLLLYSNENESLHLVFVRRQDTRAALNPFQASLLTLEVIINSRPQQQQQQGKTSRNERQAGEENLNRTANTFRAPVIRNRYQSLYGAARVNKNIQFSHEFDTLPQDLSANIDLDEHNWQTQLGGLLKCSISNQIGASEICYAKVNVEERSRSASTFESARWRMPSLAHKSLLIISILIGFSLVIFLATALILGPQMKKFNMKKDDDEDEDESKKESASNGQSTSSQKSSVLGLLNNNADISTQGSSDDDSCARLNQLVEHNCSIMRQNEFRNSAPIGTNEYRDNSIATNYDQPRGLHEQVMAFQSQHHYNERTPDKPDDNYAAFKYRNPNELNKISNRTLAAGSNATQKGAHSSTGSKLLASLKFKSLAKFKVDRISDLTNFTPTLNQLKNLHSKNPSNSETNTTGLSASALSGDLSAKMVSPTSSGSSTTFFADSNLRHSYSSGFRARNQRALNDHQQKLEPSYYLFDHNGLQESDSKRAMHSNSRNQLMQSSYLKHHEQDPMDRFIQQREPQQQLDSLVNKNEAFYRSHSARNNSSQAMYIMNSPQLHPQTHNQQINRGPPVFPRTTTSTSLYNKYIDNSRPLIAARSRHLLNNNSAQQYQQTNHQINHYPISTYHSHHQPIQTISYPDTIDSHLDRIVDNIVVSHYQNQQLAYANTAPYAQDSYNIDINNHAHSTEHIYDTNAYATPEQSPLKRSMANSGGQAQPKMLTEMRPARVSQLIQSFNSKVPEL